MSSASAFSSCLFFMKMSTLFSTHSIKQLSWKQWLHGVTRINYPFTKFSVHIEQFSFKADAIKYFYVLITAVILSFRTFFSVRSTDFLCILYSISTFSGISTCFFLQQHIKQHIRKQIKMLMKMIDKSKMCF